MTDTHRPKRGLDAERALQRWSDPVAYAAMKALEIHPKDRGANGGTPENAKRLNQLRASFNLLEERFLELLSTGSVLASGIAEYGQKREVIEPSLWDVLEIDFDLDDICNQDVTFQKAEFFEPTAIPLNIHDVPQWLRGDSQNLVTAFHFKPDYREITLDGEHLPLGPIAANVIRLLHEASRTENPWRNGKELLQEAGSSQLKMGDFFKDIKKWRKFIASDKRGRYRLKLD